MPKKTKGAKKKAAPSQPSKKATPPPAPKQQTVKVQVEVVPRKEAATMPKKKNRSTNAPSGNLPRAFAKGSGYSRFAKSPYQPKARTGQGYQPIIIMNPTNPNEARAATIGKRGKIHPASKWGDTQKIGAIVKALPGAALVTAAAAVGVDMFSKSASGLGLAKKLPGGKTGLTLLAGAGLALVAMKYKNLLLFLGGLGLGAYAIVKFSNKEAKILESDDFSSESLPDAGSAPQLPAPTQPESVTLPDPENVPAPQAASALNLFRTGRQLLKDGKPEDAIPYLNKALTLNGDQIINFYIGSAYQAAADAKAKAGRLEDAKDFYKVAISCYKAFITNATPNDDVDSDALKASKDFAQERIDDIRDKAIMKKGGVREPLAGSLVAGSMIAGDDLLNDVDDLDDAIAGDDDGYDDEELSGEGDGYDDNEEELSGDEDYDEELAGDEDMIYSGVENGAD